MREDTSLIHQPDLYYFNSAADWSIAAQQGRLRHADKVFEFERDVNLSRHDEGDPLQLRAASMLFKPENETAHFSQALDVTSPRLRLTAESAKLDFKHGRHVFNQVKAVYDDNHAHQPG